MTHPSGAGYRHSPKWVGDMKRAEGGEVQPAADGSDREQAKGGVMDKLNDQTSDAKDDLTMALSAHQPDEYFDSGISIPGRQTGKNEDYETAHGYPHMRRAHGGRVRKRADGGVTGPESMTDPDADTSPMAVEERGRSIPMSQNQAVGQQSHAADQQAMDPSQSTFANRMMNELNSSKGD